MSRAVMSVVLDTSFHNSLQKYTIFVSRTYINLWHTNAAIFLYFLSFYRYTELLATYPWLHEPCNTLISANFIKKKKSAILQRNMREACEFKTYTPSIFRLNRLISRTDVYITMHC